MCIRDRDTALAPVDKTQNHQLDVLQAGATVVARDRVAGRLAPIDVRSGQLLKDRAIPSPPGAALSVGNGTVASLDPATGALRATWAPADAVASVDGLRPEDKPTASVGIAPGLGVEARGAAATVGADGVVHLVGSSGQVATLRPDSAPGRFAVTTAELGAALQDVQVALVGDRLVIVDVIGAVSYTHLDVYKRQAQQRVEAFGDLIKPGHEVAYDRAVGDLHLARAHSGYRDIAEMDAQYEAVVRRVTAGRDECASMLTRLSAAVALPGGRPGQSVLGSALPGMLTKEQLLAREGFSSLPTSPAEVKRFWDSLSALERASLLASEPRVWGNLNGVPCLDRDWANRTALDQDLSLIHI